MAPSMRTVLPAAKAEQDLHLAYSALAERTRRSARALNRRARPAGDILDDTVDGDALAEQVDEAAPQQRQSTEVRM